MSGYVTEGLLHKLESKPYRDAYMRDNVRTCVAHQIRALREQRGMSQTALGKLLGKPQSVVSRLEDPEYGKLTLQSLFDVAAAFDVALLVRFATFSRFLEETADASPAALQAESFCTELPALRGLSNQGNRPFYVLHLPASTLTSWVGVAQGTALSGNTVTTSQPFNSGSGPYYLNTSAPLLTAEMTNGYD
jgi:transcriptional regulator with XRE-family HTH domain